MPSFPSDDEKDGEEEQEKEEFRLGQVPQWLDLMKASEESPKLTVHYGQFSFLLVPSFTETRILTRCQHIPLDPSVTEWCDIRFRDCSLARILASYI
jgi:hypothetical protein